MRAIDTNVLIRLLARDDERQYNKAMTSIASGAWVSHVVLVETLWVLSSGYDYSERQSIEVIRMLLSHENFILEDRAVVEEALLEYESNSKVGFVDCLILSIARQYKKIPLLSFDKALNRLRDVKAL